MRIFLDVETTGFDCAVERIVEVAAIAYLDELPVLGEQGVFHHYVNPQREIGQGAMRVHRITNEFVQDKPTFAEIAPALVDFLAGHELVAHNAGFDMGFIDHQLRLCNLPTASSLASGIVDTVALARKKFPGQKNNLDAVARRGNISLAERQHGHGALVDARILAQVYRFLTE